MSDLDADVLAPGVERVRLEGGEVHLWWGKRRGESAEALGRWLSDEERRRCERFRLERDGLAFAFRRAFLRSILAGSSGIDPEELVLSKGSFGKPALARPGTDLRFNASSSGGWVLVAVAAGRELGVDLEGSAARLCGAEELSALARRVLCASESAALAELAPLERGPAFQRAWARKEALLKWLGTGLSVEPVELEVGVEPRAGPHEMTPPAPFEGPVQLLDLPAPRGFAAGLALALGAGAGARFPRLRTHRPSR